MSKLQKKNGRRAIANQATTHESGVSMASWLFFKMDRLVQLLEFRSRGDFLILGTTIVLDMCEDRTKRYLPEIVLKYDALRTPRNEELQIATPEKPQRCGTHFSRGLEDRIAAVVKHVLWSRNQFVGEAMKTIIEMCEDPSKRVLPIVVIFYDAARAYTVPIALKRKPLHVIK
jgi:hypothetical protein